MRIKKSTKSALNIASSEFVIQIFIYFLFVLLLFFFFRNDTICSWLSSSVTSKTLGVFVSSLFWMPHSAIIGWLGRWLANHIQKISRCSMCTMQQLLSDFFPTDNRDALFSDQPQSIAVYAFFFFFYNLSLLRYRMVPFVDALVVSDTCRYRFIDCSVLD